MNEILSTRWKPVKSIPKDGTYVLAYGEGTYFVGNQPESCFFGRWKRYGKEWYGSAIGGFTPELWTELPTINNKPVKK